MHPRVISWLATWVVLIAAAPVSASAEPLVADLSSHLITITSSYTGTDLLLFGAIDQDGDVIVVIRGPEQPLVVRHKGRLAGVWLNRSAIRFAGVPGFYAVAATKSLGEIASASLLARHEIGTQHLRLEADAGLDEAEVAPYRAAIVRNMQRVELYPQQVGKITWLGKRLFRTEVHFPTNVPVGNYTAEVYLIRDNEVASAQTTPLFIRKTGIERAIFEYAHKQPFAYGVLAVLLAMAAGWLAAAIFRKT